MQPAPVEPYGHHGRSAAESLVESRQSERIAALAPVYHTHILQQQRVARIIGFDGHSLHEPRHGIVGAVILQRLLCLPHKQIIRLSLKCINGFGGAGGKSYAQCREKIYCFHTGAKVTNYD